MSTQSEARTRTIRMGKTALRTSLLKFALRMSAAGNAAATRISVVREYHTPVLEQRTFGIGQIGGCIGLQCGDVVERAEALGEIETIADHELVGDLETDVLAGQMDAPPGRLGEQRADLQ